MRPFFTRCLGLLFIPVTLWGGPPLLTGDALPADLGVLEIYAGQRYQKSPSGSIGRETSTELAYGLTDSLEASVELPYLVEGITRGWEDVSVASKYSFSKETAILPAAAISVKAQLPTASASQGLGNGATVFSTRVRAQKSFGHWTTLGNVAYTFLGEPKVNNVRKSRIDPWFTSLAEEWRVLKNTRVAAEVYLQTRDKPGAFNRFAYSFAIKQKITPELRVHAALGTSFRDDYVGGPKLRAFLGLKYEWKVRQ